VSADFDALVRQHLRWQAEVSGVTDPAVQDRIARAFLKPILEAGVRNRPLLDRLRRSGLRLGVVSNACGNASVLCDDLGYSGYLSCVVDSRLAGVAKPDPAIFALAVERLQVPPHTVLMVGDSYERDIVPAHSIGLQTAWLTGTGDRRARGVADALIRSLADLLPLVRRAERMPA
jgi:putative hydrolase of the HAD superfamily